jgi:hypothetical protein
VIAPVVVLSLVWILNSLHAVCQTPGEFSGCEFDLATLTVLSPLPGAAIGFIAGLVRGFWMRKA